MKTRPLAAETNSRPPDEIAPPSSASPEGEEASASAVKAAGSAVLYSRDPATAAETPVEVGDVDHRPAQRRRSDVGDGRTKRT